MEIALISSKKDIASLNIRNNLLSHFDFDKTSKKFHNNETFCLLNGNLNLTLFTIDEKLIHAENIDNDIESYLGKKTDLSIFLSKHISKDNKPAFTCHSIGNWGKADYGGADRRLCTASPIFIKLFFAELNKIFLPYRDEKNFETTMEATHHGPYVNCPAVFVEIGSTENEWNDNLSGELVAKSVMNSINNFANNKTNLDKTNFRVAFGIGGTHYCNNFFKIMIKTNVALGHICPKYILEKLDDNLIKEAIESSVPKADFALLDWKGLGQEKQRIISILDKLNVKYERSDKLLNLF